MTNLLPPAAKKQIKTEYWVRVVCVWLWLWSGCLLVGAVLLWPTHVLISGNSAALSESTVEAVEQTTAYDGLRRTLTASSKQAQQVVELNRRPRLSDIEDQLQAAAANLAVELSGMSIARAADQLEPITVSGTAANRRALASFRDALNAISFVDTVALPVDNLAQNENITFMLTVTVTPTTP